MTTVQQPRCLGCGTLVPAASGRRLISSPSSVHLLPTLKELMEEKVKAVELSLVGDVTTAVFVCRKCFRALESFQKQKSVLFQNLENAIKYMATSPRSSSSVLGKHTSPEELETLEHVQPAKRSRLGDPPIIAVTTGSSSPSVQVALT